ncbi:leucine-rich repeat domain-containing protein [Chloroflexota bacterium]
MKQIIRKGRLPVGVVLTLALVLSLVAMVAPPFPKPIAAAPDIVVTFPDGNLQTVIRDAIEKSTGDIYDTDLLALFILDGSGKGIADLTGLEYCVNLTNLHLTDNQISNILPLQDLTNLTQLLLVNNQISDVLPLQNLTNLISLYLINNQISDVLPLQDLTNLTYLYLNGNQISDILPLQDLTNLTYLYLGGNHISDILPLQDLTNLTHLYLNGNQISDISALHDLTNLTNLDLTGNQISDISTLQDLTNLTYLYLQDNQISDIQPLVDNTGLGAGDIIDLTSNPLNSNSIHSLIPALEARGVTIYYTTPPEFVSPVNYNFGSVELGSSSTAIVTISNLSDVDLVVTDITLQTGSSSDYAITMPLFLPVVISPAGVADIEVTFTPSVKGCRSTLLKITSSDPDEPLVRVTLSGTGVGTGTPPYYPGPLFDTHLHTRNILPQSPETLLSYLDRENVARAICFQYPSSNGTSPIPITGSRVVTLLAPGYMCSENFSPLLLRQHLQPQGPCWGVGECGLWTEEDQDIYFDSPQMQTIFDEVNKVKGIVMIHFGDGDPGRLPEFSEIESAIIAYPDAIFLFHSIGTFPLVAQLMDSYPNVYFTMDGASIRLGSGAQLNSSDSAEEWLAAVNQTSLSCIVERNLEDLAPLLQQYPDRIFWGTDFSAAWHYDESVTDLITRIHRRFIGRLPADIQEKYAYKNAQRVFGRFLTPTEYETPPGDNIVISDNYSGVTLEFTSVNQSGITSILVSGENPGDNTTEFLFLDRYYDINTEASYSGNITITIAYDDTDMTLEEEGALRLYHWNGAAWEDVTVLPVNTDGNLITGIVASFSWFAVGTGPQITWLPPLATGDVYIVQDGSTVPIKFQLTDLNGNLVDDASVNVTVTRDSDSDGLLVLSKFADFKGNHYHLNVNTKGWEFGEYTINVSVPSLYLRTEYGLSVVEKGKAKGKQK